MKRQRPVLGRGLAALLPVRPEARIAAQGAQCVPLDRILPPVDQPRRAFDHIALDALAESVKQSGVLQPLLVRPEGDYYRVIAGERRLRAAKMAGLDSVPVVVREASDQAAFEMALIENLQREDLDPIEEALAYKRLLTEHPYTAETLAKRLGRDRSTIANAMRLLALPQEVLDLVVSGGLSAGHARALLAARAGADTAALARRVVEEKLTVRQAEQLARALRPVCDGGPTGRGGALAPHHALAEKSMCQALGLPVRVSGKGVSGKVVIEFRSLDDLRRIEGRVAGIGG